MIYPFRIHTHLSLWQPTAARPAFECPECLDPFALCWPFSSALGGRNATDYYGSAAPAVALVTCPPILLQEATTGSGVARIAISPSAVGTLQLPFPLACQVGKLSSQMNGR
jgi:hypothetical protein